MSDNPDRIFYEEFSKRVCLRITFLLSISVLFLSACGGGPDLQEVVEGVDVDQNPLKGIDQISKLEKDLKDIESELKNLKPVDPLSYTDLITGLPDQPSGWEAAEAKGESTNFGEFAISQASRSYKQGNKTVKVQLFDWAHHRQLYAPFVISARFSKESTEGYSKGLKIGDAFGREEYTNASKKGKLSLLVDKRFMVEVDGRNIEPQELQDWWKQVKIKNLRAKAK